MLVNDKVRLRAVEPEDLEKLYCWENDASLWAVGNTRQPYSKYALKQYVNEVDKNIYETCQLRFMIVEQFANETVGTVDLFDFDIHNSRIALGLFIDKNYQGKGYATSTLRLVEEYVFNFLNVHQLYCHIAASNEASRRMFEKEKYESQAVLKNWLRTANGFDDVIVFQRLKTQMSLTAGVAQGGESSLTVGHQGTV